MSARKVSNVEYPRRRMNALERVSVIRIISPFNRRDAVRLIEGLFVPSDIDSIHVEKTKETPDTYLVWQDHSLADKYDDPIVRVMDGDQIFATGYGDLIANKLLRRGHTVRLDCTDIRRRDLLYRSTLKPVE